MSFINKTIELPKGEGQHEDKFILTKQAVKLIQSASDIIARFESNGLERDEKNSWLKIIINETFRDEKLELNYFMPINVNGIDMYRRNWKMIGSVCYLSKRCQHPIQALVREGDILTFNPYPNAHSNDLVKAAGLCADVVNWEIWRGAKRDKVIGGYFSGTIVNPENPHRAAVMHEHAPSIDLRK